MHRAKWKSKIGFVWAAIGSAIGLGSIWRFPYIVGQSGGGAFILLFVFFLFLISLPILMNEVLIGRTAQANPSGAFYFLSKHSKWWRLGGRLTIFTGFCVSSFYSVISGWTLAYLLAAIRGSLIQINTPQLSEAYFTNLTTSAFWPVWYHFLFFALAIYILYIGVQKGIEAWNRFLMPLLFIILTFLAIVGISSDVNGQGLKFLFSIHLEKITPSIVLVALGQAFFGLSLGQGTMVTYGSYLHKESSIPYTTIPIATSVVVVSLLAGCAIFPIVFATGLNPAGGPDLLFKTLPIVLSKLQGGYFFSILFFLLVFLAALTSQISALEPAISYLIDEKKFKRHEATALCGIGAFALGIPSALAFGALQDVQLLGQNIFELISNFSINFLIPIGGLLAVLLTGWKWGAFKAFETLIQEKRASSAFKWFYILITRFVAPVMILAVLISSLMGL